MRLINTETLILETFPDIRRTPPYAVLSHTWGRDADEVSLQEMMVPGVLDSPTAAKPGFEKIGKTCQLALETHGLKYAWVDTCCIDKTSSAELSEAINSMFKWYQQAAVCFAFLEDWEPEQPAFDHCRWWTRGWTLQELVAPLEITFFDRTWSVRGHLNSLCSEISKVSRIKEGVLMKRKALSYVPVAVRMSWASHRQTTREEDIAYCLMGIFDINMAMLYGEGSKAFLRLQQEIINTTSDMSLFAWTVKENAEQAFMGILASSPNDFSRCLDIITDAKWTHNGPDLEMGISNLGLKTNMRLFSRAAGFSVAQHGARRLQWTSLVFMDGVELPLGIYLKNVGGSRYVRAMPGMISPAPPLHERRQVEQASSIYLLSRLSSEESAACTTRQLTLKTPWAKLASLEKMACLKTEPPESRTQLELNECLQVSLDRSSTTMLHFISADAQEVSSFLILCRFYILSRELFARGFWECDVLEAGDTMPSLGRVESNRSALSGKGDAPFTVSKTLELARGRTRRKGRKRAVTVTLERQHTGPKSDPVPIFFLDVKMDISNP
jgi:hypothetical protein